jgi:hypothetical protein
VAEGFAELAAPQGDLPEVALALRPAGCLTGALDRREQKRNQQRDDRDHDQEFDKGEAATRRR